MCRECKHKVKISGPYGFSCFSKRLYLSKYLSDSWDHGLQTYGLSKYETHGIHEEKYTKTVHTTNVVIIESRNIRQNLARYKIENSTFIGCIEI